jgi:hypothetical protein
MWAMSDRFNAAILETINRCRRLASITHDGDVAEKLRELAETLEADLQSGENEDGSNGGPSRTGT